MALITTFVEGYPTHEVMQGRVGYASRILDFSETTVSANDVVQCLPIGKGTFVLSCGTRVITPEGAVATADLGDGEDPNGYGDGNNLNSVANTIEKVYEADAYGNGKYYANDDTIDLTVANNLSSAIIEVWVYYARPSKS